MPFCKMTLFPLRSTLKSIYFLLHSFMSDQQQPATGADVNALRNNVPLGESRDFEVTAVNDMTVAARVSGEPDFDADNVTFVPEDYRPKVGVIARFTRVADASMPSGSRLEVSALETKADEATPEA